MDTATFARPTTIAQDAADLSMCSMARLMS
jgi:hypothetical protein